MKDPSEHLGQLGLHVVLDQMAHLDQHRSAVYASQGWPLVTSPNVPLAVGEVLIGV